MLGLGVVVLTTGIAAVGVGSASAQERAAASGDAARENAAVLRGTVHGTVAGRRVPLAHAWISVSRSGEGGRLGAVTDGDGRYRIAGVPPGVRRIEVSRIGYRPHAVQVTVPAGTALTVDLELEGEPLLLAGVTVAAEPARPVGTVDEEPGTDLVEVALRSLELAPGGPESGLAAARALGPGEGNGEAPTLLIRSGEADPKQVLLDGVPVHTPFHLGGLLPAVDASLLADAEHWVGAAPATVTGGLSRVVSLRTRAPAKRGGRFEAGIDAVSARALAEAPLARDVSGLLSLRGLHGLGARLLDGGSLPYGYGEALVRLQAEPGDRDRLSLTGFWNRESVRLDFPVTSPVGVGLRTESAGDEASWGNGALSLRWVRGSGERRLAATLAGSRYHAALPLGRNRPAWATGQTDRVRLSLDARRPVGPWALGFGVVGEALGHRSSAETLVQDEVRSVRHRTHGTVAGGYVEARRPLAPDVTLRAGLRADHFSGDQGLRLSPRASLSWLLSETAVLRVAAGRHFYFVQPSELEAQVVLDDPGATRAGQALYPVAGATHLVLSLDQALTDAVRLELDGYVKGFDGLPEVDGGTLRASGVDLRIRRAGVRGQAWLGYSLAWFWNPESPVETATASPAPFRGRHLLSAGLDGRITELLGGSVRVAYGDGLPLSSVPLFGSEDATAPAADDPDYDHETIDSEGRVGGDTVAPTLDGFFRVDLELFADFERSVGGHDARFRPYLRVMNALDRRDALFYYFEPWQSPETRPVAERAILPVLGMEVKF